jgi:hypothetical protein
MRELAKKGGALEANKTRTKGKKQKKTGKTNG